MADHYHRRHVRELLKHRKILFLGDSNVRPLYKDLLCSIRKHDLPTTELLSGFDSKNFEDKLLQKFGLPNAWDSWEHRIYEKHYFQVEMFFMGQITPNAEEYIVERLRFSCKPLPNVVYVSFSPKIISTKSNNPRCENGLKNFLGNLRALLPINTMFILGSGFDVVKDFFGNPCFDEIPYFLNANSSETSENCENTIKTIASSLEFHFLNVAYYHRRDIFRGITSHPCWQIVVVRYTTCLLLTHIAVNLSLKHPNKVTQATLRKAIAETQADDEEYRRLLLRLPCDWESAKQINSSAQNNAAADNAHELVCILWSQLQSSSSRRLSRAEKERKSQISNLECGGQQCDRINDQPDDLDETISSSSSARDSSNDPNPCNSQPFPTIACDSASTSKEDQLDEDDDLEEGEIRDPSPTKTIQNRLSTILDDVSDIDSSETDYSDGDTVANAYFSSRSPMNNFLPQDFSRPRLFNAPDRQDDMCNFYSVNSCVSNDPIEVSDEEPTRADGVSAVPLSIVPGTCIISSDESDTIIEPDRNSKKSSKKNFPSASNTGTPTQGKISGLALVDRRGKLVPWPIKIADSGIEKLWRWWKKYLSDNNGVLTLRCPGLPDINAKTPRIRVPRGDYLVLPKIIDDLSEFLTIVKSIPLPTECLEDPEAARDDDQRCVEVDDTQDQPSPTPAEKLEQNELPPRKITFTFSQKTLSSYGSSSADPPNRIRVRSFGAINNIARHCQSQQYSQTLNAKRIEPSHLSDEIVAQRSIKQSSYRPFGPWISSATLKHSGEYRPESIFMPDGSERTARYVTCRKTGSHYSEEPSYNHLDLRLHYSSSSSGVSPYRCELSRGINDRDRSRSPRRT